jgi:hypothetical protein
MTIPQALRDLADLRNDLAKARDAWFESAEGKRAVDSTTLPNANAYTYLRNRLESAFIAGWNAKENQPK